MNSLKVFSRLFEIKPKLLKYKNEMDNLKKH